MTTESDSVETKLAILLESSFEGLSSFSSFDLGSSFILEQEIVSLVHRVSILVSVGSLERGNFGLGSVSGGVLRGGTLGL